MDRQTHNTHLKTEINGTTPQRLHLMLIDGALRYARKTLTDWEGGRLDDAHENCRQCRNLLVELFSTTKTDTSEISERTADLYVYLMQAITQADMEGDTSQIDKLIRILEIEQGTWREICQRFPHTVEPENKKTTELDTRGKNAIPPPDLPHRRIGDTARTKPSNPFTPDSDARPGTNWER